MKLKFKKYIFLLFLLNTLNLISQEEKKNNVIPLNLPLKLSGNFGEIRGSHFHAGIDIKTNGKEGYKIKSILSGYISRISISTNGYGKAIYIDHPNGTTSVYAHLKKFSKKIEEIIKKYQYKNQKYEIQKFFKKDEIKIEKEEFIGYSGNTGGSSGPHLHFEIRDQKNQNPINPLNFGYKIIDSKEPTINNLFIYSLEENEVFENGQKNKVLKLKKINDSLYESQEIELGGKFGLGIQSFDRHDLSYNRNGVYKTILKVNDKEVFEIVFDKFSFNDSKYINYLIDYLAYREKKIKITKLFLNEIPEFSFLNQKIKNGRLHFEEGKNYDIKIELFDYNNNSSSIKFKIKGIAKSTYSSMPFKGFLINKDEKRNFIFNNKEVTFFRNSFYENKILDIINKPDTLFINNNESPLNKQIKIKFNIPLKDSLSNQIGVGLINSSKKLIFIPGVKEDGGITIRSKSFGKYVLTKDSIKPTVNSFGFKKGDWMTNKDFLKFKVDDDFSGVKFYNGFINKKWILLEYEPKNKTLKYDFKDHEFKEAELNIEIKIEDFAGNKNNYSTKIFRKPSL